MRNTKSGNKNARSILH